MLRLLITILIYCFLGWLLCDINPNETYTWYSGIWQGIFFIPNLIRSWFSDALFKAEHYTAAYNVFYWIFATMSVISLVTGGWTSRN